MFRDPELELMRRRKELLVLQSDTSRLLLAAEWQRLRKPAFWLGQTGNAALRHPLGTAALGLGAGLMLMQLLRRPMAAVGWLGKWGAAASTALSVWKLLARARRH